MDRASIIAELEAERDRLTQAIAALRGTSGRGRPGRPKGTTTTASAPTNGRKRRPLSEAARKRIGEAMKKKWAERKKKAA